MIVLKYNDTIYVANSCWSLRDPEAVRTETPIAENLCMWHPKKRKKQIIATSTYGWFTDMMRYVNIFPSMLRSKELVLESYKKMREIAERFNLYDKDNLPIDTVFAEGDRAYVLNSDSSHMEIEEIYCRSAEDEAVMTLYHLKGVNDPYDFFREAFQTIESIRKYVMFPVAVMNTKNNKIEIINR